MSASRFSMRPFVLSTTAYFFFGTAGSHGVLNSSKNSSAIFRSVESAATPINSKAADFSAFGSWIGQPLIGHSTIRLFRMVRLTRAPDGSMWETQRAAPMGPSGAHESAGAFAGNHGARRRQKDL